MLQSNARPDLMFLRGTAMNRVATALAGVCVIIQQAFAIASTDIMELSVNFKQFWDKVLPAALCRPLVPPRCTCGFSHAGRSR